MPAGAFGLDDAARTRLAEVVHQALAAEPAARFASMAELALALDVFCDAPAGPSPGGAAPAPWSQRRVDWALARAARLQAEAGLVGRPGARGGADELDETLSRRGEWLWRALVVLFVLGLAAALWVTLGG